MISFSDSPNRRYRSLMLKMVSLELPTVFSVGKGGKIQLQPFNNDKQAHFCCQSLRIIHGQCSRRSMSLGHLTMEIYPIVTDFGSYYRSSFL